MNFKVKIVYRVEHLSPNHRYYQYKYFDFENDAIQYMKVMLIVRSDLDLVVLTERKEMERA